MTYALYNLGLILLYPAIAIYILYRVLISRKSKSSWRQQMGFVDLPDAIRVRDRIWIHAVSVGESVATAAVVSEIKRSLPDVAVVVSTTTETGQAMACKSIQDADGFLYYPFDLPMFVSRSLARVEPCVFATVDTEIWPNFLHLARRRGVKTAIVNGTVSDKTLSGARRVPWLYKWALSNVDCFCMQSDADAQRIIKLGADAKKVVVAGNVKADQASESLGKPEKDELRSKFGFCGDMPVFVAGSTNPGEDGPVLDAFMAARESHPYLRLIIAPRQIERGEEIAALAREKGLKCGRRSASKSITGGEDVIILDTFGELASVYAIADVAFVGGSLIPRGCHSILQPIAQGKPVFFGPYTFKAKDLVAQAKAADVGFEVSDGAQLGREISHFLGAPELLGDVARRCMDMMSANRGASKRTADALVELYRQSLAGREG